MSFVTIVLAYCLSRFTRLAAIVQHDGLFEKMLVLLNRSLPQRLVLPAVLLLSVVALAVLLYLMSWWLALLLGVLVFLYSLGRGDWRSELLADEQRWLAGDAPVDGETERELWQAWVSQAASQCFDGLFAVFFWFFLLGPIGALVYRLSVLYQARVTADSNAHSGAGWLHALMWLPARYMGLCVCLAGNFTSGFSVWRQLLLDTRLSPPQYLHRCVEASLLAEENDSDPVNSTHPLPLFATYADNLRHLLARTEIIGLVGIAVAVLLRF